MSKNFCNFARKIDLTHRNMKNQEPKQMPIGSENHGLGTPQQQYFTADEAMAFLEPRIRAMFK